MFSGKTGKLIHHLKGDSPGDKFGYEVSEMGDIDGDGACDFLVGAMGGNGAVARSGKVLAYSGKEGKLLFTIDGLRTGDGFGNAAAVAKISDDKFLLAIGAPNAGLNQRGQVYVYEIGDSKPEHLFDIEGDENSVNLGQMFISFPGDLDGDGIGDLIVGAWQNRKGAISGGKVYLFQCPSGKVLDSWTCKQRGDTLGFDATGIGDVNGDGNIDFLLTSAWSPAKGPKTGRVFIVAGKNYSKKGRERP